MNNNQGIGIRKLIHLLIGLIILILSYVSEKNILLFLITGGTIFAFLTFNNKKFYRLHRTSDASLGTLFYPLGILSSYLILYNLPIYYFQSSLMVLTISDTLANLSGRIKKGNSWFSVFHDKKSLYGTIVFAFSAFLIFKLFLPGSLNENVQYFLFLTLWAAIMESAALRGSDNFTIPAGLSLFFLFSYDRDINYFVLFTIIILMASGGYLLHKYKILTRKGSFTAFLLGFYLAGICGWNWFTVVLFFFVSSVILTKLHHSFRGKGKTPDARNFWQVIANIIWAFISSVLYLLTGTEIFIMLFIVFVAAVTADTWASETGPMLHRKSFSLSEMRMEPAGTTGGISFFGSVAAFAGALSISSVSYFIFFGKWNWYIINMLSVSAFLACFADSLIGAFLEDKLHRMNYFRKQRTSESISPNDLVNIAGSLTASLFFIILLFWYPRFL